jgi:mono/diheme cytochrome c family protein
MGLTEIQADASPAAFTSLFLYSKTHASLRRRAPVQSNPLQGDEQTLIAGGRLYLNDCVGCHGEPGKPASQFGASFYPPAPQLAQTATEYTEAEILWIAKHGIRRRGMAAQGPSYSDEDLWRLAAFVRRMTKLPPRVLEGIQQTASNFSWDTFQYKLPNATLAASNEFDQPSTIALASSRTLDVAAPVVEG